MQKLSDYYSVEAAAAALGLKYKTLLQRIARGTVRHETFGRMKLVPKDEVERIQKEQAL